MVKKVIEKADDWTRLTKIVVTLATGLVSAMLVGFTYYVAKGAVLANQNSITVDENKCVIEQVRKDITEMKGDIKTLLERTK